MGSIGHKRKSSVLKTELVDVTEKGTQILAESIHRIHTTNMEIEGRRAKISRIAATHSVEEDERLNIESNSNWHGNYNI